jgi:hypothetical protein
MQVDAVFSLDRRPIGLTDVHVVRRTHVHRCTQSSSGSDTGLDDSPIVPEAIDSDRWHPRLDTPCPAAAGDRPPMGVVERADVDAQDLPPRNLRRQRPASAWPQIAIPVDRPRVDRPRVAEQLCRDVAATDQSSDLTPGHTEQHRRVVDTDRLVRDGKSRSDERL